MRKLAAGFRLNRNEHTISGSYLVLELGALEGVVPALATVLDLRGGGERDLVAAFAALQCSRACDFT